MILNKSVQFRVQTWLRQINNTSIVVDSLAVMVLYRFQVRATSFSSFLERLTACRILISTLETVLWNPRMESSIVNPALVSETCISLMPLAALGYLPPSCSSLMVVARCRL